LAPLANSAGPLASASGPLRAKLNLQAARGSAGLRVECERAREG